MWLNLKCVVMINVVSTLFTLYLCLHEVIAGWVWAALLVFDTGSALNKTFGISKWLCRMMRWDRPLLTRQQAARRRYRSPRVYVRSNRRSKNATTARLWYRARRPAQVCLAICAASICATSLQQQYQGQDRMRFDTDSFMIGIDNCASRCLTDNKRDFVGPLQRHTTKIKGIGGNQDSQWTGTVKWPIIDDEGRKHELLIPNTVLVPKGSLPFRLLSPQHFAQENLANGTDKRPRGTLSLTSGQDHILSWADKQFTLTAPLTSGSNIALIDVAPDTINLLHS
jgi:hypothetical protein